MKTITYTINTTITATTKTPQINQIITALTALFPDKPFTLEDTVAMTTHGLVTKQDPRRTFAYYQNDLIAIGFLAKSVEVTEKPAKPSRIAQIRELVERLKSANVEITGEDADDIRQSIEQLLELTK